MGVFRVGEPGGGWSVLPVVFVPSSNFRGLEVFSLCSVPDV